MKTRIAALLSMLLIGLVASAAFAGGAKGTDRSQKYWQRVVTKLSLTPDQQTQLQPIFQARQQQMKANREAGRSQFLALLTPDQQATMKKNQEAARAARTAHEKYDRKSGWKALNLTADQKAQMKNFRQQNRAKMEAQKKQYVAQVEAVLNDTQKTTFEQMMAHQHKGHDRNEHKSKDGNKTSDRSDND